MAFPFVPVGEGDEIPGNPYQMESDAGSVAESVRSAAGSVHAETNVETLGQIVNAITELTGRMDRMGLEAASAVTDLQAGLRSTREDARSWRDEAISAGLAEVGG